MSVLTVENLSFDYSDARVLRDVAFQLEKGDFLGVIGSNGTGKSTLIKLILGLLPCQKGSIRVFDREHRRGEPVSGIGYVSQKANSFNSEFPATVREVVMANLYSKIGLFHHVRKEHETLLKDALEQVGMSGQENKLIGKLSGGQQQRVFIARALISQPELLLLDEPTVGVDAKSVESISGLIAELNQKGMTIIMTNHDTPDLIRMSQKLLVLGEDGHCHFFEKSRMSMEQYQKLCGGGDIC